MPSRLLLRDPRCDDLLFPPLRELAAGAEVERPGVARDHLDVDLAVMTRATGRISTSLMLRVAAQDALGLLDRLHRDRARPVLKSSILPDHLAAA